MSQRLVIDSRFFSKNKLSLEGGLGLSDLARLASSVVSFEGDVVRYSLRGDCGAQNEPLLLLVLRGSLTLQCQRCLQPMSMRLDVDATFELRDDVTDDVLLQDDLDDDSRDYLSASRKMDLISLIEDEVLLALPLVPKHDVCSGIDLRHKQEAASPFGGLLSIKGPSGKTH
jgi:uncharacterized protein